MLRIKQGKCRKDVLLLMTLLILPASIFKMQCKLAQPCQTSLNVAVLSTKAAIRLLMVQ
jgi:hypothetical protein